MKNLTEIYPQGRSRKEIATIIFPDYATPAAAVARLGRWINDDPVMRKELYASGYRKGIHWFTPKIIRVLERFFL